MVASLGGRQNLVSSSIGKCKFFFFIGHLTIFLKSGIATKFPRAAFRLSPALDHVIIDCKKLSCKSAINLQTDREVCRKSRGSKLVCLLFQQLTLFISFDKFYFFGQFLSISIIDEKSLIAKSPLITSTEIKKCN